MVNRTITVGNIGKDAEVKTLDSGAKVAKFSVATTENYRDKNGEWQKVTTWLDVVAWRELADRAATLSKGDTVYVEGKISTRDWEDQNGNKRRTWEIVASYFRLVKVANPNAAPVASAPDSEDSDPPF